MPSRQLSADFGRTVVLKLECLSAIRSFKARGAIWCLASLSPEQRAAGVITASTGNHGQGVAYAGGRLGVNVTIVAPRTLDPAKRAAMENLGAQVRIEGEDINESSDRAMELAQRQGLVFVEDGDDVALLAGAATVLWEMLDDRTDLDCLIVPVGGGNLIASCLWLAQVLESPVTVVGVQSAMAPGATLSWLCGTMTEAECRTAAGGLATRRPGALALSIMDAHLRTMSVVDEEELGPAVVRTLSTTGLAVELAAASGIAALDRFGRQLPGEVIGIVLTGGWIAPDALTKLLAQ
jgi:threonine dehydratase